MFLSTFKLPMQEMPLSSLAIWKKQWIVSRRESLHLLRTESYRLVLVAITLFHYLLYGL